ncbi:MAG: NAD(P)/FAD-dependent oxidoreductase [Planctomycetota bacterium]
MRQTSEREVIVVGAGLAGLAAGHALAAGGIRGVLVLESEPALAVHTSGRSAGMVRRLVEDPWMARLAIEGADDLAHFGAGFARTGSFLLGARARVPVAVQRAVPHRFLTFARAAARVPLLAGHGGGTSSVLETPDDGVVDVPVLLRAFTDRIADAGGEVQLARLVEDVRIEGDRVVGVVVAGETLRARHVVLAVGAWAAEWGQRIRAPLALQARRRHVVCTGPPAGVPIAGWPWVWDLEGDFYFRPLGDAELLWSPCDDRDATGEPARSDAEAPAWLAAKLQRSLPAAAALPVTRTWAGHRTFAADGRVMTGPDPRIHGLHWAVGLGGHGVAICMALGRRVAWGVASGAGRIEAPYRVRISSAATA